MRGDVSALSSDLMPTQTEIALFAICHHSLPDHAGEAAARSLADPERALHVLWLLKDADGLDRVRLGEQPDPAQLRSARAKESIEFARAALSALS